MAEPCTRRLTTRRRLMDTTNAPIRGFKVVSVEQTNEKCDAPSDMKCFRMKVTVDVEIDEEGNIVDTLGDIISILPQVFDVLPLQAKFVTAAGIFEGQVYSLNAPVPNRMSPVAIVFIVFAALSVVVVAAAFGYRRHQQRKAAASAFAGEKTDETPDLGAAPTLSDIAESSDAGESRP